MEQFIIEQAKPEDAALLLDYMKAIGGETDNLSFGAEGIHINADGKAKQLAAQQQSKDNVLFVAKAAGAIIGDASLERMPRRMNHRGEFGIAVRKAWWGCAESDGDLFQNTGCNAALPAQPQAWAEIQHAALLVHRKGCR